MSSEYEVVSYLADQIRLPLENTQQDAGLSMDEMDALDEITGLEAGLDLVDEINDACKLYCLLILC